jgi:ferredoxin
MSGRSALVGTANGNATYRFDDVSERSNTLLDEPQLVFAASKLAETSNERVITLSERAYQRLVRAKKEGEDFSNVILRLSSTKLFGLQKRGENEIKTSDNRKLIIRVEQDLCLGAESCATLAPEVFALDESHLGGSKRGAEPLGMMDVEEGTVESERIIRAARSCPYQAIKILDGETGEQLCP